MDNEALEFACEVAKPFEGLRLDPYHCPAGMATIGYGHLLSRKKWADLSQWESITEAQAHDLLISDMVSAQGSVNRLITAPLTVEQEGALIDFTFNLGGGSLQASTLRKVINRGDHHEAPKQFMRWVYAGGRKLNGLVRRREAEVSLWLA